MEQFRSPRVLHHRKTLNGSAVERETDALLLQRKPNLSIGTLQELLQGWCPWIHEQKQRVLEGSEVALYRPRGLPFPACETDRSRTRQDTQDFWGKLIRHLQILRQ